MDGEDVTKSFAPDFPAYMYGQLEVNEKGLARMYTLSPYGDGIDKEFTDYKWKMKDDETAVFHDPDLANDITAYIEDGCLVFSPDGKQLYLERVDEFHTLEKDDIDNETKQKFVGKWELAKFILDGEDMTEMLSQDLPVYAYLQLEIHENGSGTMKMSSLVNGEIEEKTENFEWKMKDAATAVLHLTDEFVEDSELFFRYGELVMRDSNSKDNDAYFEKVEEFHKVEAPDKKDNAETASDISDFVGKWECFDLGGIKENLDVVPSEFFKFEIKEDGSCTLYLFYSQENEYSETYTLIKKEDGTFEMDADYEIFPAEIENGILKVEISETLFSFKKVSEFTVSES